VACRKLGNLHLHTYFNIEPSKPLGFRANWGLKYVCYFGRHFAIFWDPNARDCFKPFDEEEFIREALK